MCCLPLSSDVVHTGWKQEFTCSLVSLSGTERNSLGILFVYPCTVSSFQHAGDPFSYLVIYNHLQVFSSRMFAEQVVSHVFMQWIYLCLSVFLAVQLSPLNFTLLFSTFYRFRKNQILSLTCKILEFNLVWECVCFLKGGRWGERSILTLVIIEKK